MENKKNYSLPMAFLTMLFFMWGFITCLNDILIPHFKAIFTLSYFESMLIQFAFFSAYFVGSLIYFFISSTSGDPINKIGYKNGILLGLLIAAFGTFLFYPAAELQSFGFFLTALFVLALGFTLLQIAANVAGYLPLKQSLLRMVALSDNHLFEYGENAKKLVINKYLWDEISKKTILLYNWMINKDLKPDFIY